jgi:3-hydroxyacyl-[acyl-carrier-protein] dehydratase
MNNTFAHALAALPHGPEFRFVDEITAFDAGKTGSGQYTVRGDELFLRGHFPGQPLMPGVLLLEAAAQLAGIVAQCDPDITPLNNLKLTAIRGAKILGTARPGEVVRLEAQVTGRLGNLIQARATAHVNGQLVLHTDLTLSGDNR